MPDGHAVREWIGIALAVVITFLLSSGLSEVRSLRANMAAAEARTERIEGALARHTESAADANIALAKILGIIDARLQRLEEGKGVWGDGR